MPQDDVKFESDFQTIQSSISTLRLVDIHGPIAQPRVAEKLNITLPAAFFHCQKLNREGLVKPVKMAAKKGRGRPSALWDIDKSNNYSIGLTIVPPLLLAGLSDFSGKILFQKQYDLSEIADQRELLDLIDEFISTSKDHVAGTSGAIRSVLAGLPGYLEGQTGTVFCSVNMPLLVGLNIEEYIQDKHGLFCQALSHYYPLYYGEKEFFPPDTTLSVIEWELGLGHVAGCNNEIYTVVGPNNLIPKGIRDIAHMRIIRDGRSCHCGQKGCLEAYTGGWAILQQLNRPDIRRLSDIVAFAKKGDEQVLDELNRAMEFLGIQMTWVVRFLGTDRIVFTGPLCEVFPLVKKSFYDGLRQHLTDEEIDAISPMASLNPLDRILRGSCKLGKHVFLYPDAYLKQRGEIANAKDALQSVKPSVTA